jgi:hypothetical protein
MHEGTRMPKSTAQLDPAIANAAKAAANPTHHIPTIAEENDHMDGSEQASNPEQVCDFAIAQYICIYYMIFNFNFVDGGKCET